MVPADNDNQRVSQTEGSADRKQLSPAAERALQEAEARRKALSQPDMPAEYGGRGGADPSRFGDWEINGRAIDF